MKANNQVLLKWSNIIAFAFTVIVNSLAGSTTLIGGVNTAQISDSNPTLITPAGYVFSIWGVIYVLLGVFAVLEGGEWASHLFAVNPSGDSSLRGLQPSQEKMAKAIAAWKATGSAAGSAAVTGENAAVASPAAFPGEWPSVRQEMLSVGMAAATGNAQAAVRMAAFAQIMGGDPGMGLPNMPNPNDILLAQQGDRAAIARIRALRDVREQRGPRHGKSGLQTHSFLSFHPPLSKRAKRLQKMGATMVAPVRGYGWGLRIFLFIMYLVLAPLMAAAGAMMLVAIALMIMLNLLFLTLWLTVIHWAFAQDWVAIAQGFAKFVGDLITAINKARR